MSTIDYQWLDYTVHTAAVLSLLCCCRRPSTGADETAACWELSWYSTTLQQSAVAALPWYPVEAFTVPGTTSCVFPDGMDCTTAAARMQRMQLPSFSFSMADVHPDGGQWLHSPSASPRDGTPTIGEDEDTTYPWFF